MRKLFIKLLGLIIAVSLLCGCQQAPSEEVVISKNDGSFDINMVKSATEATNEQTEMATESTSANGNTTQTVQYIESFFSTDGSVKFEMNITEAISDGPMPVVEVQPHYLSNDDAQRVANALFGDAIFYEAEPYFTPVYSKAEIQAKIARWTPYCFDGNVADKFVTKYTLLLETAPTENPHTPCKWDFKKETYYYYSTEEAESMDTTNDNDQIQATVRIGDIPYVFSASTRNKTDFKLNYIYAKPDDGASPEGIDTQIFRSMLCETEEPTDEALNLIKEKAAKMLSQMELGSWMIDECYVELSGSSAKPQYTVHINAVPVFNDVAAFRRPQLENLKSKNSYASNYYLTDAHFQFSVNGDLVYFKLNSPVEVKAIINDNVQVLSMDELFDIAKSHFSLTDYYEYDTQMLTSTVSEDLGCLVEISSIDYGLTRVKVPNTDESYYYVPAVVFNGTTQFYGIASDNVYNTTQTHPLLILNAVDGTVINATNQ